MFILTSFGFFYSGFGWFTNFIGFLCFTDVVGGNDIIPPSFCVFFRSGSGMALSGENPAAISAFALGNLSI